MPYTPLNLPALRERLPAGQGQQFWRSLEELAGREEFRAFVQQEMPSFASAWHDPVSRRRFLQLMGASLALAGLNACTSQPEEPIVPYARSPEALVPGQPLFFATALSLSGFATGVVAESHMGRPTKIEGNTQHPASLGATDVFLQASVLSLYDPDRSQTVQQAGRVRTWNALLTELNRALEAQRPTAGAGLRILTETVTSPTLAHQLRQLRTLFPQAIWHQYEPVGRDTARAGARLAFGEDVQTTYRFDQAQVVLALEADVLAAGPGHLSYARTFMRHRQVRQGQTTMNRLYVVESTPSLTGAIADHRLPLRASEVADFARAVAQVLEGDQASAASLPYGQWVTAIAQDLQQHRGASLVVAGDAQAPIVHALAHAMNHRLGNVDQTVRYTDPVEVESVDQMASLQQLVSDMAAGKVELLVILGGNPVYTAPADLQFSEHLNKVKLRVHLGLYDDETAALCHWHIPEAHALETWSDGRAYDGTVSLVQPLIAPLYGGKSVHELLAVLMGQPERTSHQIVREYWQSQYRGDDFEMFWRTTLHDGAMAGTALPPRQLMYRGGEVATLTASMVSAPASGALELVFRPDATVWDGRFANNGWLQELPEPLTKLAWDNAALVSPATAARLTLRNGDVVELRYERRMVRAPVWMVPGQADGVVTLPLGYGRWRAGHVGTGVGYNAYALRTTDALWFANGLEVRATGTRHPLATTQQHHSMEGRHLVRVGTLEQFVAQPHFVHDLGHTPETLPSLYPAYPYGGYAWGMVIDLSACLGCNACTIACQAENNIPIVGKDEVARGREMHWLRIDRYYHGDLDNPATYHQPVLCMHCENAPCEVVCPTAATVHSSEGLNDMIYNRCIGTRYCANNCPYKVRRFNFFQYADYDTLSLKLLRNPDVTVRTRGVMEKCTYCIQRITAARIAAKKEDRPIRDGEVITACQAACPTQAIVFGNINDPDSQVAKLKASPLNYGLLAELGTRPRTTYLARLRNPNPMLEEKTEDRG
jgi:molybdopterin-containing oxidoreductase family iron-sulfur binding subunit